MTTEAWSIYGARTTPVRSSVEAKRCPRTRNSLSCTDERTPSNGCRRFSGAGRTRWTAGVVTAVTSVRQDHPQLKSYLHHLTAMRIALGCACGRQRHLANWNRTFVYMILSTKRLCCTASPCRNFAEYPTRALRERKPPPTPKFQPKVIRDLNPYFRINPDPDPDVCWILSKMPSMNYLVGVSHFAKYGTNRPSIVWKIYKRLKVPYFAMVKKMKKWSAIHMRNRGSSPNVFLEGHPLSMPAKFGRRPFPRSSVILFTEWQNDHITTPRWRR